jgi:tRNA pseudouridine55 synthase
VARRKRGDAVDGVLLLDKPAGLTSNAALQTARRLLAAAKGGHTGTLDPLARGLLPLAFGEATKFAADLLEADKTYEASVRLGVRTTSGDADGEVLQTRPVEVTRAQLDAALMRFTGPIMQVPPMTSALKRDGKALYEYARAGIEVERAPRAVTVHRIDVMAFDGTTVGLVIECSKGTYVRTLADDLGEALGCGAHLSALTRTRVGDLTLDRAVSLEALEAMPAAARRDRLLPVDTLLARLPRVALGERQARAFLHGGGIDVGPQYAGGPGRKRVYGPDERLLGLAELDDHGLLNPRRLVAAAP